MNSLVLISLLIIYTPNTAQSQKTITDQGQRFFTPLHSDNSPSLSSHISLTMIEKLTADAQQNGRIENKIACRRPGTCTVHLGDLHTYTGSQKGITLWDGSARIEITTENSDIPENNITALAIDKDHNLLIGTYGSGMVKGYGRSIKPWKIKPIITQESCVTSINVDTQGLVWVLYQSGCFECFENDVSYAFFNRVQKTIFHGIPKDY